MERDTDEEFLRGKKLKDRVMRILSDNLSQSIIFVLHNLKKR